MVGNMNFALRKVCGQHSGAEYGAIFSNQVRYEVSETYLAVLYLPVCAHRDSRMMNDVRRTMKDEGRGERTQVFL